MTQPLALFGGTFDPIHVGHLRAAWDAAEVLDAQVRLMPTRVPPHRPQPLATPAQRAEMVRLALRNQDRLVLDARELERAGTSYTIDTLQELRSEVGATMPIFVLVGADAFAGLPTWKNWQSLFDLAHVGVLTRPGHGQQRPPELDAFVTPRIADPSTDRHAPCGHVVPIAVTPLEVSATLLRDLLADGRDPRYLVPDAVGDYIRTHRLYRDEAVSM